MFPLIPRLIQPTVTQHLCGCYLVVNLTLSYKKSGFALGFQDNITNIWKGMPAGAGLQQGKLTPSDNTFFVGSPSPLRLSPILLSRQKSIHSSPITSCALSQSRKGLFPPEGGSIVWILNITPKGLYIENWVPSLVLLGIGGTFKSWSLLEGFRSQWMCPEKGWQ